MKRILIFSTMLVLLSTTIAYGKRMVPEKVPSITDGKIEYRAPHFKATGCVEAWQGNDLVWSRQIYVIKYIQLEKDVQDVFITKMTLKDKTLIITNERGSEYELHLETLEVKVIKGSLVEQK